ncbi:uncharacterized protein LOC110861964 [Folsomia candida]|uniref:uncharacterized protein LOC110861964 n=1 Tax=Folsomia candida TaxID=158441 RepID=UPI000B8EECBB|nr:uncharacterized protein LOC110861964 [Folsomia candida]
MQALENPSSPSGSESDLDVRRGCLTQEKAKIEKLENDVAQFRRDLKPALEQVREAEANVIGRREYIKHKKALNNCFKRAMKSPDDVPRVKWGRMDEWRREAVLKLVTLKTTPSRSPSAIRETENVPNILDHIAENRLNVIPFRLENVEEVPLQLQIFTRRGNNL